MNNYYVYAHQRQSDGKCFYIGKGKGNRARIKSGRNKHWWNVVNKHGYDIVILVNNISEVKANELEISFIQQIGLENLANVVVGGGGTSGYKYTDEQKAKISLSPERRAKISASKLGKTSPNKGKKMSDEQKAKISAAMKGKKMSEETKAKISAGKKRGLYKIQP